MSDLISRSTAMKNYCNALCPKLQKGEYCNNCIVKAWLNNQPTAYDVDKVLSELEKVKPLCLNWSDEVRYGDFVRIINIVKAGGTNE